MGGTIKGGVLASRRRFVTARFGDAALARIVASLPQADREVLDGMLLPFAFYPVETQVRFDEAIVAQMGAVTERAFWELGRESANDNVPRFQSAIVRGKTPMAFLHQTPTIYKLYYGTGRREFVPTGDTSGTITTYDAEGASVVDCLTVMGWHERALEIVGARAIRITHPICRATGGPHCRYEVSWGG